MPPTWCWPLQAAVESVVDLTHGCASPRVECRDQALEKAIHRAILDPADHGHEIVLRIDDDDVRPVADVHEHRRRRGSPHSATMYPCRRITPVGLTRTLKGPTASPYGSRPKVR